MHVSESRASANRRNSLLSTGPKTPEGKDRSRLNAIKHGLCSSVVVPEDQAIVEERTRDLFFGLNPQNQYHNWLVDKAAIVSVRMDRAERIERRVRDKVSLKAAITWDDDRRLEVEFVGNGLAASPASTVQALKRSLHGCEWLMTRWAMLACVADEGKGWTEDQQSLAFDLLATPPAFRKGRSPGVGLDFEGRKEEAKVDLAAFARERIAELKERREAVADVDESERALAEADLVNDAEPELRRLRRYESTLYGRFRWFVKQINDPSPHKYPSPNLLPNWAKPPEEHREEKPEPPTEDEKLAAAHPSHSPHPPFDLEPHEFPEPGQKADIPMILRSRKQERIRKAEARRASRRRKVEKLRA